MLIFDIVILLLNIRRMFILVPKHIDQRLFTEAAYKGKN